MSDCFSLIKIGTLNHMISFYEKGELYFNSLANFQYSSEPERGDPNEGLTSMENLKGKDIRCIECNHTELGKFSFTPRPDSIFKISHYDGEVLLCHSLYTITGSLFTNSNIHNVDERMRHFGEQCVMITDYSEFLKRIRVALNAKGLKYAYRQVQYKDYERIGVQNLTIFNKDINFAHQNEFRLVIKVNSPMPVKIQIGSLKDIAKTFSTQTLLETTFSATRKTASPKQF